MSKTIGVAEVKRHFSEVVSEVSKEGEHFIIERKGKPMAAMVGIKELALIERDKQKGKRKGLLAALGAWDDFKELDKIIAHIYKKRGEAKDRRIKGVS
ncbi:MAG: type II toxin-antitoxin system Phd/YefM family antitoxin [Deltaproteobacteria bacterium]|nr:type II toxin-antitoxin system Phd/YefM family antitoxin [Deltaproteobacteria bacterium]